MSHALATVLHRGRKAASNIIAACLGAFTGGAWHPDTTLSSTSCRRAWHPPADAR